MVRVFAGTEPRCPAEKAFMRRENHTKIPCRTLAQELDYPQNIQRPCL
jgi:hypothetical protein